MPWVTNNLAEEKKKTYLRQSERLVWNTPRIESEIVMVFFILFVCLFHLRAADDSNGRAYMYVCIMHIFIMPKPWVGSELTILIKANEASDFKPRSWSKKKSEMWRTFYEWIRLEIVQKYLPAHTCYFTLHS